MSVTIGVDASNIRGGGGLTYLENLLRGYVPDHGLAPRIVVWASGATLSRLPTEPWLDKCHQPMLEGTLASRALWQRLYLDSCASGCDLLFVPGGTYVGSKRPYVAMSHNLLPFEQRERARYGVSPTRVRLELLRILQSKTLRDADGVIFLTDAAKQAIEAEVGLLPPRQRVVPHGIDESFVLSPRRQAPLSSYSSERPFRWLYVSIVDVYKHQWNVVAAVRRLRDEGIPVSLDLVGPAYPPALRRLDKAVSEYDPAGAFVRYHGRVVGTELVRMYKDADALVFASTCENMPIILMEGMAAGLPIVSGDRPVMREVLRNGGEYCNPENIADIARAMRTLVESAERRQTLANRAFELTRAYSWRATSQATFSFLCEVAQSRCPKRSK
jgi:glycosyltransferase involved in cell wall biosynthesis